MPPERAREAEETARAEGKTLSAVIQEALRLPGASGSGAGFADVAGTMPRGSPEDLVSLADS